VTERWKYSATPSEIKKQTSKRKSTRVDVLVLILYKYIFMKVLNINWAKALMMIFLLSMIACGKKDDNDNPDIPSDPNIPVADPAGTVTANISENTEIEINGTYGYNYIGWISPDNFYVHGRYNNSICDLGFMRGLGNITSIPTVGYTTPTRSNKTVACETDHGYVVKFEDTNSGEVIYVRLYVVEPIVNTLDGIMGAKVKYVYSVETPEPVTLDVSTNSIDFSAEGGAAQTVEISTNASEWKWTFNSPTDWISVNKNNNTLSISVKPNEFIIPRSVDISVTVKERVYEHMEHINITQNGLTQTSAPYTVGDIYKENGVEGIVYKVTGNGSHGMILSLDETKEEQFTTLSIKNDNYGCTDENNGMNNMNSIKQQASWEGRFPAFKWCNDKGSGWYMPAINELKELYAAYCGLTSYPGEESRANILYSIARTNFNNNLARNGGTVISYEYMSSTITSTLVSNYSFGICGLTFDVGKLFYHDKHHLTRAIRAF
jgi:hypothetical protein